MKAEKLPVLGTWTAQSLRNSSNTMSTGDSNLSSLPLFNGRLVTRASQRFCASLERPSRASLLGIYPEVNGARSETIVIPYTGYMFKTK